MTSPNGKEWTTQNSGTINNLFWVTYGNGIFVATGDSEIIVTSPDGVRWTVETTVSSLRSLGGIGTFVAIGNRVFISHDATTWTTKVLPRTVWRGIAAGPNTLVGVGPGGAVIQSDPVQ